MDIDDEASDGADGARPQQECRRKEKQGVCVHLLRLEAPVHRPDRKRRQSQRMAGELCQAFESSSPRVHSARYQADLNTMD